MSDKIVVREEELEQMIQILQRSAQELEQVQRQMQAIAQKMEGGALLGMGGEAFAQGLNNNLARALNRLGDKLVERSRYVQRELNQNRAARRAGRANF